MVVVRALFFETPPFNFLDDGKVAAVAAEAEVVAVGAVAEAGFQRRILLVFEENKFPQLQAVDAIL